MVVCVAREDARRAGRRGYPQLGRVSTRSVRRDHPGLPCTVARPVVLPETASLDWSEPFHVKILVMVMLVVAGCMSNTTADHDDRAVPGYHDACGAARRRLFPCWKPRCW